MKKIFTYTVILLLGLSTVVYARKNNKKNGNARRAASTSSNKKRAATSNNSRRQAARRRKSSNTTTTSVVAETPTTETTSDVKEYTFDEKTMDYAMKSLVLCMENKISSELKNSTENISFEKSLSGAVSMTSEGENLGSDFCNNAAIKGFIQSISQNISTNVKNYNDTIAENENSQNTKLATCDAELNKAKQTLSDAGKQIYLCYNLAQTLNKNSTGFLKINANNRTVGQFKGISKVLPASTLSFYKTDYQQTKTMQNIIDELMSYYTNNSN